MERAWRTQRLFRVLMQAMANPGRPVGVEPLETESLLEGICETLFDHEVHFAAVGCGVDEKALAAVRMITGCSRVALPEADYIIVAGGSSGGLLAGARVGTLEYPDRGATVLYPVASLQMPGRVKLNFTGPGIRSESEISLAGIELEELELIQRLNRVFPLGVDAVFFDSVSVLAIPRSAEMNIVSEN